MSAYYRQLASRTGKVKAVTTSARKLALLFYNTLRYGSAAQDPGVDYYEARYRQGLVGNLHRRAKSLGFELATLQPLNQRVL
ncbi:hypothetical protein KUW00_01600 [Halomonas sp. DP5N14-9]|uniref:hypothetical protein n=1 Tax=Halomonas sp. DP5N14-9 TaxID=2859075 RepID=UPI001C98E96C|nr:hypothetical protein [Halomonas sp. DP5N14-9]MBY5939578.1 hypothetical protein [Halomonas sp. DP5N14-9]